jgi:hypothetical protein
LSKNKLLKLNAFWFLLRISMYQILIQGLAYEGLLCTIVLIAAESVILAIFIKNFKRHKFLKNRLLLLAKIVESTFLLIVVCLTFTLCLKHPRKEGQVNIKTQKLIIMAMLAATFSQILLSILIIGRQIYDKFKLKSLRKQHKHRTLDNKGIIKYKMQIKSESKKSKPESRMAKKPKLN